MIPPVIDAAWLADRPDALLVDVRWYPGGRDPDGRDPDEAFAAGHLPGAVPLGLDRWLSGEPSATGGRHPLPAPAVFAEGLRVAGIPAGSTVIGYDDAGGVIAARLVWMLRAWGVDAALLDGGMRAWAGRVESGPPAARPPAAAPIGAQPWPASLLAGIDEVGALAAAGSPGVLLDARPADRYAGAPDDLDPRAGHIPGAVSLPCRDHIGSDGRLLPVDELRRRLDAAGADVGVPVVSSCGSGVTACHTLLVLEHVGRPGARLYPGSWSEWSRTDRPIATGVAPR